VDRRLWFIQLSGWPVFLLIVLAMGPAMIALSVVFSRLGNRSVLFNAGVACLATALLAAVLLAVVAIMARW
jgi:hypothetical protein